MGGIPHQETDVVVPLVAIANPAQYVTDPLRVFELDFEANLEVVRQCVSLAATRVSLDFEIYGMSPDAVLRRGDEPSRPWTGQQTTLDLRGLRADARSRHLCLRRARQLRLHALSAFNFIGPNLDNVDEPKEGSSRVFTQFLSNIMYRRPILLVDGGEQKRSFTFIEDAMECLMRIIENA
jgi:nucleoside-diphosphate-sugar epimerase